MPSDELHGAHRHDIFIRAFIAHHGRPCSPARGQQTLPHGVVQAGRADFFFHDHIGTAQQI